MKLLLQENPLAMDYLHISGQSRRMYDDLHPTPMGDFLMRLADEQRVYLSGKKNLPVRVIREKVTFAVAPSEDGLQT
ncbi:MAG: hypothetical protein JJ992_26795, partial [Planctomycetes bacterium]|nr:hypothetical protein [Planctomycetota bacterium]